MDRGDAVHTSSVTSEAALAGGRRRVDARDRSVWIFVAALAFFFWVPEIVLKMGWPEFWILFFTDAFIWSLFAVAFNLLMGYTGLISFGQAAYLGIGGYATGLLLKKIAGFPFALGFIAAPVASALGALVIGYFCIRLSHIYFAMLTLAFSQIVYFTAFKWYDFTGGDNGLIGVPVPDWVQDPTFTNYYRFVLVVCVLGIFVLWRVVNSAFGKTLTAIRENPERAGFIGIDVKRYELYAFMIAGAFSGLAGALITLNERSVYPDLAFWTRSTQVLLMSIVGGVYTFSGPIVGAFLLLFMDADITQNYPGIWQLFLGAVLVVILFGLPGGIMGFIQSRETASADDAATRLRKSMAEFRRKFWYLFAATLVLCGFFLLLKAPDAWMTTLAATAVQAVGGALLFPWMLRQLGTFAPGWRLVFLVFPIVPLAVNVVLRTPPSGLMIVVLWAVFIHTHLWRAEVRAGFRGWHRETARPLS
jgi:branched-chain amino acid transport system permease protein